MATSHPTTLVHDVVRRAAFILAVVVAGALAGCSGDTPALDSLPNLPTTVVGQPAPVETPAPTVAPVDTPAPTVVPVETPAPTVVPVETPAPVVTEAPVAPVVTDPSVIAPPPEETGGSPWWPWVLAVSVVVLTVAVIARRRAAPAPADVPPAPLVTQWQARALQVTTDVESAAALLFAAPTSGLAPERWSVLLRQTMRLRGELTELQRTAPSTLLAGSIAALGSALGSLELASEADVATARPSIGNPLPPSSALLEAHRRVSLTLADILAKINPTPTQY
jgi:hypothetical protein